MKRWRDFVIYLSTLVASVFGPMCFDACLKETCAMNVDGTPDESCWRRALNYITLSAARFRFISLLVLPVDLANRCVGKRSESGAPPDPVTIQHVPYVIWADSPPAAKPNKTNPKSPKATKVPEYLKNVKSHRIRHHMTHCGGVLADMPKWVDKLELAIVENCVFVGVWSFDDFFAKPSPKEAATVRYHLTDECFNDLNRFIDRLDELFPKSVMICGGSGRTWGEKDIV